MSAQKEKLNGEYTGRWTCFFRYTDWQGNSCTELYAVNEADIWRERTCEYLGRSRQREETEYEPRSNNEWREVSRGHSTERLQTRGKD